MLLSCFRLPHTPYPGVTYHIFRYTYLPVVRSHAPSAGPYGAVGGPYLGDDEAAVAAAIGASLDMLDLDDNGNKPNKEKDVGKKREGGGDGAGITVGGGGIASITPPRPGSNASQDLAFLTDAPLLPPAGAPRRGEPMDTNAAGWGRNDGSQGGRETADGALVFGEGGMWVAGGRWGLLL